MTATGASLLAVVAAASILTGVETARNARDTIAVDIDSRIVHETPTTGATPITLPSLQPLSPTATPSPAARVPSHAPVTPVLRSRGADPARTHTQQPDPPASTPETTAPTRARAHKPDQPAPDKPATRTTKSSKPKPAKAAPAKTKQAPPTTRVSDPAAVDPKKNPRKSVAQEPPKKTQPPKAKPKPKPHVVPDKTTRTAPSRPLPPGDVPPPESTPSLPPIVRGDIADNPGHSLAAPGSETMTASRSSRSDDKASKPQKKRHHGHQGRGPKHGRGHGADCQR